MYNFIINPKSKKKYLIHSKYGLNILRNYIKILLQRGGNKGCSLSLASGRCRKSLINDGYCIKNSKNRRCIKKKKNKMLKNLSDEFLIKTLIGPVSFRYYEIECKNGSIKKILLLGDFHTPPKEICSDYKEDKNCVDVHNFIINIINKAKKKNKCIDLFIEQPLKRDMGYFLGGTLNYNEIIPVQFNKLFYNCMRHNNYICEWNNLRLHTWDLRFGSEDAFLRNALLLDDCGCSLETSLKYNENEFNL